MVVEYIVCIQPIYVYRRDIMSLESSKDILSRMSQDPRILYYETKTVWGNNHMYPACSRSEAYLKALGFKVFTVSSISALRALGIELKNIMQRIDAAE